MQYGEVLFRQQKTDYNRRPLYIAEVCTQIFHLLYSRRPSGLLRCRGECNKSDESSEYIEYNVTALISFHDAFIVFWNSRGGLINTLNIPLITLFCSGDAVARIVWGPSKDNNGGRDDGLDF